MPYIYKITNDINQKIYIGKTLRTISERWNEHLKDYQKASCEIRPLYRAMNKYGVEHFKIEEVEKCEVDVLSDREVYWIEFYESFKNGYNATKGGDGKPYLDYSLILKLYQNDYNCSDIAKITGYSQTSIRKVLNNNDILKEERLKHCGQWQNKIIQMIDKNTGEVLQIFPKIIDAYKFLGKAKSSHIQEVCQGKRKSAYGYKWAFLD